MKAELYKHTNVPEDGVLTGGTSAVSTNGSVVMSDPKGGCGIDRCNCQDGHWVEITFPRTEDGIVEGVTINFDNRVQMTKCLDDLKTAISEWGSL